jgi:hypothetical protein
VARRQEPLVLRAQHAVSLVGDYQWYAGLLEAAVEGEPIRVGPWTHIDVEWAGNKSDRSRRASHEWPRLGTPINATS